MGQEAFQLLEHTLTHPENLWACCTIRDKYGDEFRLSDGMHYSQAVALSLCEHAAATGHHLAILKSRQVGMSTLFAAWQFWRWWTSTGDQTHLFYLHVQSRARKFARQWAQMYYSLPKELQDLRPARVLTDSLTMEDTGAILGIATAKGSGGARSATVTTAVCSEYPFWKPDRDGCEDILSTIQGSLAPGGVIVVESTAAYHGDALYALYQRASTAPDADQLWGHELESTPDHELDSTPDHDHELTPELATELTPGHSTGTEESTPLVENPGSIWLFHFDSWLTHPEYTATPPTSWEPGPELPTELESELDRAYWYSRKVDEMGSLYRARREFPLSPAEAWGNVKDALFADHDLRYLNVTGQEPEEWRSDAQLVGPFAAGSDVAWGVQKDWSTLYVVDVGTGQLVYRYRTQTERPQEWARHLDLLLLPFHYQGRPPLLLVESNGPGADTLATLRVKPIAYTNLWLDPDTERDWTTDQRTKRRMFSTLKDRVVTGQLVDCCHILEHDLRSLRVDGDQVITPRNEHGHCDVAVGAALAYVAAESVVVPRKQGYDPFRRRPGP